MQTGIIQTARRRITATGRTRVALLAATGAAATAATIGLALPAGAAPVRAAVTGAEHFQIMSTSATADTTCSQLSITSSTSRSVNQRVSASS